MVRGQKGVRFGGVDFLEPDDDTIEKVKKEKGIKLILAAHSGDIEEVTLLLNNGVDPNFSNRNATALIAASDAGHEGVVSLLLSSDNIDPNIVVEDGTTALVRAANKGRTDVVKLLLKHEDTDPNLHRRDDVTVLTRMIHCIVTGNISDDHRNSMAIVKELRII